MSNKIIIKVPATTANIGPGFDVLGMALDLYNEFIFRDSGDFTDDNLIIEAYKKTFDYYGEDPIPKSLEINGDVPISRGLGSSSTCIVAGVAAAILAMKKPIDKSQILQIATDIEGHPDNVAPAIYGGLIVSLMTEDQIHTISYDVHEDLRFYAMIPDFEVSTAKARAVLPLEIALTDGIFNASRIPVLLKGLETGDQQLISPGVEDKFHQDYRKDLITGYQQVTSYVREQGASPYISGAGPTLIAIKREDENFENKLKKFLNKNLPGWKLKILQVDTKGFEYNIK